MSYCHTCGGHHADLNNCPYGDHRAATKPLMVATPCQCGCVESVARLQTTVRTLIGWIAASPGNALGHDGARRLWELLDGATADPGGRGVEGPTP